MDEIRDDGQKESIDDILSDLNNLLNRMPAILEGIKLPNIGHIDFLSPRMPEPVLSDTPALLSPEAAPGQTDGEAAPSAPEPAKLPEPEGEDGAEEVFDAAAKPEPRPETEAPAAEERPEPASPSLEEHMFSQNARPEPSVPADPPVQIPESGKFQDPEDLTGEHNIFNNAVQPETFPAPETVNSEGQNEPAPPSLEEHMFSQIPQPELSPVIMPECAPSTIPEQPLPPVSDRAESEAAAPEEQHEPAPPPLEEHMFSQNALPEPAPVITPECGSEPVPGRTFSPASECEPEAEPGQETSFYSPARPEERGEEGTAVTEGQPEPVPQALEDHMFRQNSTSEASGRNLTPEQFEIKSEPEFGQAGGTAAGSDGQIPEVKKKPVYDLEAVKEEAAAIEKTFQRGSEKEEDEKAVPLFETTHDFGVPDIDTLIRLSQNKGALVNGAGVSGKASEEESEPLPIIEPADDAQLKPEPLLGPGAFAEAAPESQSALEADLDEIVIAPRAGSTDGEGEVMDIQNETPGKFEPEKPGRPAPEVADAAAPRLELATPQDFTLKSSEPSPDEPGFVIKQTNLEMNPTPPAAPSVDSGDTASVVKEEERTGIYSTGAASGSGDDLSPIADKPVPDGIPPERVRTVAVLYAAEDADLCSDVLTELDAICLKSASKPMFIKRAFVKTFNPEINGNSYLQKVSEAGAMGLICLGNIPKDSVYDLENIFNAGAAFFRHFSREAFTHSAVLDLVSELMLK